jgi:hypothetical protein
MAGGVVAWVPAGGVTGGGATGGGLAWPVAGEGGVAACFSGEPEQLTSINNGKILKEIIKRFFITDPQPEHDNPCTPIR